MSSPAPRPAGRRRYESPVRRAQLAETRERIVAAGSELAHEATSWDWRDLTARAVAERAGVSERTVYRHFATERLLHEAVMRRLQDEAGVSYEGLGLDDLGPVTARVFASLASYAVPPSVVDGAPFVAQDEARRAAVVAAVAPATGDWPEAEARMAAAMLDVLWLPTSYERLVGAWGLDPGEATRAVTWVIDLVNRAVRAGDRPGPPPGPSTGLSTHPAPG